MSAVQFKTDGSGYWSDVEKTINITDMKLDINVEPWHGGELYGELKVYFDESWNVEKDGLIYTDDRFLDDLRDFLHFHGLPGPEVCYSEQGMQGDNYVSLDADHKFCIAWKQKFGV